MLRRTAWKAVLFAYSKSILYPMTKVIFSDILGMTEYGMGIREVNYDRPTP
jgi:hypothetical protein